MSDFQKPSLLLITWLHISFAACVAGFPDNNTARKYLLAQLLLNNASGSSKSNGMPTGPSYAHRFVTVTNDGGKAWYSDDRGVTWNEPVIVPSPPDLKTSAVIP
ncbi:MAG: hypothetical protein KDK39_10770 [Leptospiraceae bacterium]|nr:hypothetical protein [Leptospiraceae bacterium]